MPTVARVRCEACQRHSEFYGARVVQSAKCFQMQHENATGHLCVFETENFSEAVPDNLFALKAMQELKEGV